MKSNHVKRKLLDGGLSLGTFVFEFNTTGIGHLAANAGADFVIFDMEHTGWSVETIRLLMASCGGTDVVPIVRVPATEYHFVARVLDMGARGIMMPMVQSREQAERLVQYAKYPPEGRRGAAFGVAHDNYTGGNVADKMRAANETGLLIAQIETKQGLENVGEIASVPGIDILWIGQFDLTSSLGIPGQFTHAEYHRALDRVVATTQSAGKTAGMMATSLDEARDLIARGFRCIAYGGDLWIYQEALRTAVQTIRNES